MTRAQLTKRQRLASAPLSSSSTDFWVNFKTFGYTAVNFIFILAHMPMLMKHMPEEEAGKADD